MSEVTEGLLGLPESQPELDVRTSLLSIMFGFKNVFSRI